MAGWIDLHAHSNYSFLDGASHVDDLVDAAVEQGMDALALTDTNGLYGAVRFANAAKERGIRPIFGTELQLLDAGHLVLIARDRQGWTSLTRTISAAQLAGEKTKPKGTFSLLAENAAGLYALTGCAHGAVPKAARAGDLAGARELLARPPTPASSICSTTRTCRARRRRSSARTVSQASRCPRARRPSPSSTRSATRVRR